MSEDMDLQQYAQKADQMASLSLKLGDQFKLMASGAMVELIEVMNIAAGKRGSRR